ncbi:hypothetical protein TraAM80_10485, partial [Trypanosoma rangeli]
PLATLQPPPPARTGGRGGAPRAWLHRRFAARRPRPTDTPAPSWRLRWRFARSKRGLRELKLVAPHPPDPPLLFRGRRPSRAPSEEAERGTGEEARQVEGAKMGNNGSTAPGRRLRRNFSCLARLSGPRAGSTPQRPTGNRLRAPPFFLLSVTPLSQEEAPY